MSLTAHTSQTDTADRIEAIAYQTWADSRGKLSPTEALVQVSTLRIAADNPRDFWVAAELFLDACCSAS